tara:strand:- start:214 stop:687 length:474 start_codon:yes stop_codon:yes gene_type:complete
LGDTTIAPAWRLSTRSLPRIAPRASLKGAFTTGLRPTLAEGVVTFQGVVRTPTGLSYEDLVLGEGAPVEEGQTLEVHYRGSFLDGKEFDSSIGKDPIQVTLGGRQVIPGFEEGLATMRVGGKRRLVIPPRLAYGEEGKGPIPPKTTLVFEVEVLSAD